MMKCVGALSILLACTLFGFLRAGHYATRPRQIRQLILTLQRLETEIVYAQTPLDDAFYRLSLQLDQPFASCFEQLALALKREHHVSLAQMWGQAFHRCAAQTSLKKQEVAIIEQLGHVLGGSDDQDQVKHIRLAISQLQMEEAESRQAQHKYEAMWRSLGCLLGVLVVILMA